MKKQISEEAFDEILDELVISYAKQADARELHQMAMEWNWDDDKPFLHWLIENPDTDRGTILMIYWKYGPRYWKQFKDREHVLAEDEYVESFDIIQNIEQKYTSGFYKTGRFAFDPNKKDYDGTVWSEEYSDKPAVSEIPAVMLQKVDGETVEPPEDFEEGIPPALIEQMEETYEQYDIDED